MSTLTTTTHRATVHALTRTVGDLDHGTVVVPVTRDGHPLSSGAFYVLDEATDRGAYVTAADVTLVTGYAVIVEHVAGWTTVLAALDEAHAETMARALDEARPVMPAVASVRPVEICRQH